MTLKELVNFICKNPRAFNTSFLAQMIKEVGGGGDDPTPPSLPIFKLQDSIIPNVTKAKFNTNLSYDQVMNILKSLDYIEGEQAGISYALLVGNVMGESLIGATTMLTVQKIAQGTMGAEKDTYVIAANERGNGAVFISEDFQGYSKGWIHKGDNIQDALDENDEIYILEYSQDTIKINYLNPKTSWNGILVGVVEGEPAPGIFTPFEVGQTLVGIEIDPNAVPTGFQSILTYLESLDWNGRDEIRLVQTTKPRSSGDLAGSVNAFYMEGIYGMQIFLGDNGSIIWASESVGEVIPANSWVHSTSDEDYEALTGKVDLSFNESDSYTIININPQFAPLNGVLIGAVEAEPGPEPGGLTPFADNDSFGATSLKCNISMSNADITAVLADIANETALISLDADGDPSPLVLVDENEDAGKVLVVADLPIFVSNEYSYEDKDTGDTITVPAGWQYDVAIEGDTVSVIDRTTGVADLSILLSDQSFPCVVNSEVSGWNGVIIGKNEAEPAGGLTPFKYSYISGIDFGDVNNGEINEDLNEFLNQFDLNAETVLVTDFYPKPILTVSSNAYGYPEIVCYDLHSTVELYSTDQGFKNLVNGTYMLDKIFQVFDSGIYEGSIDWNGILIGAIEVELQPGLTQFQSGEFANMISFSNYITTEELNLLLEGLPYQREYEGGELKCPVLSVFDSNNNQNVNIIQAVHENSEYKLVAYNYDAGSALTVYSSLSGWRSSVIMSGIDWNNNFKLLNIYPRGDYTYVSSANPFNGGVFGKPIFNRV